MTLAEFSGSITELPNVETSSSTYGPIEPARPTPIVSKIYVFAALIALDGMSSNFVSITWSAKASIASSIMSPIQSFLLFVG